MPAQASLGRWVGIVLGILSILGILFAFLNYVVTNAVRTALTEPNTKLSSQDKDIGQIRKDVEYMRRDVDRLLDHDAKQTLQTRASRKITSEEIKTAAKWAVERRIPVDVETITKVSRPLFQDATTGGWEATIALLNLRSFVNSTLDDAKLHITQTMNPEDHGKWFSGKPGEWLEIRIPRIVLDGKPGEVGVIMDAPGHISDKFQYVIFKDATIVYRGGPIVLVNVFFDNCTFQIAPSDSGRLLAHRILESTFATFSAS
jgi:hypothetical protein